MFAFKELNIIKTLKNSIAVLVSVVVRPLFGGLCVNSVLDFISLSLGLASLKSGGLKKHLSKIKRSNAQHWDVNNDESSSRSPYLKECRQIGHEGLRKEE